LANKVRKVILKLFLSKERTAMSLHQNFWFDGFTGVLQYKIWFFGRWNT
jgi:hypothetical protein